MTTRFSIVVAAALALLVAAATPTRAQFPPPPGIAGDLAGPSPCCACDPGTGTRCGDLLLTGLGNNVSGCVGIDPLICVGGQLLDSTPPALLDGCGCIGGNCFGPVSPDFKQFDAATCTAEASRACGEAGGAVECACADGNDNDGNGLTDCDDPGCADDPACAPCPDGQTRCNGTCVDTQTDAANCGSCGNACASGETCEAGVCTGGQGCGTGQTECNGVCTDTSSDEANCGSCANACAPGQTCTNGACTGCETGKTDCNGTCVDLNGDEANCGACGTACTQGQTCQNGTCTTSCEDDETDCSGTCVDLDEDEANCGSCGNACAAGETCEDGTCKPGEVDCSDPANCDNPACKHGHNRSGGGDDTNPGGHGNENGFCNPGHGHGHHGGGGGHGH